MGLDDALVIHDAVQLRLLRDAMEYLGKLKSILEGTSCILRT